MPSGTGRDGMDGHRCRWNLETRAAADTLASSFVLEWAQAMAPRCPASHKHHEAHGTRHPGIPHIKQLRKPVQGLWHNTGSCRMKEANHRYRRAQAAEHCGAKPWLKSPVRFGPLRLVKLGATALSLAELCSASQVPLDMLQTSKP